MSIEEQLWNDPKFIHARILEQVHYIAKIDLDTQKTASRKKELIDSAIIVLKRLIEQYFKLTQKDEGSIDR